MIDREREALKVDAITAMNIIRGSEGCQLVVGLCNIFINETREANDYATGDEVIRNQGSIDAFKRIISAITVGIPAR
jgi:hypothetical protein